MQLEIEISAGKKEFEITHEGDLYKLQEAGSLVAVLKKEGNEWKCVTGAYNEEDAQKIGMAIEQKSSG